MPDAVSSLGDLVISLTFGLIGLITFVMAKVSEVVLVPQTIANIGIAAGILIIIVAGANFLWSIRYLAAKAN